MTGRRARRLTRRGGHFGALFILLGLALAATLPATLSATLASVALAAPGAFQQAPGSPIPVGSTPSALASADFNGDGHPDLAVANRGSDSVTVLLGDGSGRFTESTGSPISVGDAPVSLVAAKLDGNDTVDLAVANRDSNSVTVLLGDRTGGFTEASGSPITVGSAPSSITAAGPSPPLDDFNSDGHADLAVANSGSNDVTVLFGAGDGTFTKALGPPLGVGGAPSAIVAGYLTYYGVGGVDLAVAAAGSDQVTTLLGDGAGHFTEGPNSPISVGDAPSSLQIANVTNYLTGPNDITVANRGSNTVQLLHGNGSGNLSPETPIPVGAAPSSLTVTTISFDPQGSTVQPDVAVANAGSDNLSVLLNDGSGPRATAAPMPVGKAPAAIVPFWDSPSALNANLAVANSGSDSVSILLNGSGEVAGAAAKAQLRRCIKRARHHHRHDSAKRKAAIKRCRRKFD